MREVCLAVAGPCGEGAATDGHAVLVHGRLIAVFELRCDWDTLQASVGMHMGGPGT